MSASKIRTLTVTLPGGKSAADDGEFAEKQSERRQANRGGGGQSHQKGRDRQHFHHAMTDDAILERMKSLMDVSRREKQNRFGQRVITHVQQRAENGDGRVHGDAGADEADVFEARIGEHPLEVALHENERRRQKHGGQAEAEQQMAAEAGTEARAS